MQSSLPLPIRWVINIIIFIVYVFVINFTIGFILGMLIALTGGDIDNYSQLFEILGATGLIGACAAIFFRRTFYLNGMTETETKKEELILPTNNQ